MSISMQRKKAKVKNKGGRPKENVSDKVDFDELSMLAQKGFTDKEIAKFFKVDERTLNRWKKDKRFMSVLKDGKEDYDTRIERALAERALGYSHKATKFFCIDGNIISEEYIEHYPPDPTSMIFWLKNRKPKQWRDKQEVEHSGEIKTISETTNYSLKTRK